MTTIDFRPRVQQTIERANRTDNDYSYHSGWGSGIVMGQQYKLDGCEAKAMISAIEDNGFYKDPMLPGQPIDARAVLLGEIHARQLPEYIDGNSKGSIALDPSAARALNAYAKKLGVELEFVSGQKRPSHPVG